MRLSKCEIEAFGQLANVSLEEIDQPLVVVQGPNEAGKSTFFEFLKTMFYGFAPANKQDHPYTPWSGSGEIRGCLKLILDNGVEQTVRRALMSRPQGTLEEGADKRRLANNPLPAAAHLTRELFESVYALTLADMAALAKEPWNQVQERLLGNLGWDSFRPAREVRQELDVAAGALWRPTRSGNQELRLLDDRISKLKVTAREAAGREREVRELTAELERSRESIRRLEAECEDWQQRKKWLEQILPIRKQLGEIDHLRRTAGAPAEFAGFPEDPLAERTRLERELGEVAEALASRHDRLQGLKRQQEAVSDEDRRLLELEDALESWSQALEEARSLARSAEEARVSLEQALNDFEGLCRRFFPLPPTSAQLDALRRLVVATLKQAYLRFDRARADAQAIQRLAAEQPRRNLMTLWASAGAMLVSGVLLLVVAQLGRLESLGSLVTAVGVGLSVGGLLWGAVQWSAERRRQEDLAGREQAALAKAHSQSQALEQELAALELPLALMCDPDEFVVKELEDLKAELQEIDRLRIALSDKQARVEQAEGAFAEFLETHRLERAGHSKAVIDDLQRQCREARARALAAEGAAEQISREEDGRRREEERQRALQEHLESLKGRVADFGAGSWEAGLAELKRRREAWRSAETFDRRLNRDHPDWEACQQDALRREAEAEPAIVSEEERERIGQELEERTRELGDLREHFGAIREQREALRRKESPAQIEGEIASLKDRQDELRIERDRLALLSQVIRLAERRFRDKHQPDVLRKASRYLSLITQGRYERIDYEEDRPGLRVSAADSLEEWNVDAPLSRGIRDQIYFSLRLALVEHLDDGQETMPVLLDEVLVNWDQQRRQNGYAVLREFTRSRQVFLFTCHPWLADELGREFEPRRIHLG